MNKKINYFRRDLFKSLGLSLAAVGLLTAIKMQLLSKLLNLLKEVSK